MVKSNIINLAADAAKFGIAILLVINILCIRKVQNIYIYEICSNMFKSFHIYIYTRILGPPKAAHTNRHKTLIILKSDFLENIDF